MCNQYCILVVYIYQYVYISFKNLSLHKVASLNPPPLPLFFIIYLLGEIKIVRAVPRYPVSCARSKQSQSRRERRAKRARGRLCQSMNHQLAT